VKDTIRKLQQEFDQAELRADREKLRQLLADDFLSIGPKGFVLDKEAWIVRHDQFKYVALDASEVDVRVYDSAAIVRCVQRNRATYKNEEVVLSVRVSHMWVNVQGQWHVAGSQFSPLAQEQPTAKTA